MKQPIDVGNNRRPGCSLSFGVFLLFAFAGDFAAAGGTTDQQAAAIGRIGCKLLGLFCTMTSGHNEGCGHYQKAACVIVRLCA